MGHTVRATAVTAAVLIAAGALSGCAGTQTTQNTPVPAAAQPSPTQQFNDTDVQFVQQMILHHQQDS